MVVTERQVTQTWVNAIVSQNFTALLKRHDVDSHAGLGHSEPAVLHVVFERLRICQ